jgi:hypothetical protein
MELFHLIANVAGPISRPSPKRLCYKRLRQVRRRISARRELVFLFPTLPDHFHAPSVAYGRTFPIFAGVAATMRGRHSRLDMQPLPSLAKSQSRANHPDHLWLSDFISHSARRRELHPYQNSQLDLDSVLPMVYRWRNTKALHLVKQCGALQAESGCCSPRTPELPIGALAGSENFSTHLFFKRRI